MTFYFYSTTASFEKSWPRMMELCWGAADTEQFSRTVATVEF